LAALSACFHHSPFPTRTAAMRSASVLGVELVEAGELQIHWWQRDTMKRAQPEQEPELPDEEIKEAVEDALLYDPRVDLVNLEVEVTDNVVTLSGTVDNLRARQAAEEDARNTLGVWRVRNYIQTRPGETPSNAELIRRVNEAIERDPYVSVFDITVSAANGLVFLRGDVTTEFEKKHAAEMAAQVVGVIDVMNYIDYREDWEYKSDVVLEADVKEELYWNPYVEEVNVDVRVENGVVTLTGEVDDWRAYFAAEKEAFVAGARDVINELEVTLLARPGAGIR
jgi:osmotically-inducible protein OsmY